MSLEPLQKAHDSRDFAFDTLVSPHRFLTPDIVDCFISQCQGRCQCTYICICICINVVSEACVDVCENKL